MSHDHGSAAGQQRGPLVAVLLITVTFFIVEVIGGLLSNSLALLADAGHMLTDIIGVGLSLVALTIAKRPAKARWTFGYYRFEILAAVINCMLLLGVAVFILIEAYRRLTEPPEVSTGLMVVVGIAGLVANSICLYILRRGQKVSLNVRGAYLEVLGDFLGSIAVVIGALIIATTGFERADPIISVIIALLIVPRTWSLLRDATNVLLETTPKGLDLDQLRQHMMETPGVIDVHDLHAWTITSGMPVLSAHVVIEPNAEHGVVLDRLGECIDGHFDIEHSTFQLEPSGHQDHEKHLHS